MDIVNKVLEELKQVYDSSKKKALWCGRCYRCDCGASKRGQKSSLLNALLKDDRMQ